MLDIDSRPAVAGGKPLRDEFLIFGFPSIDEADIEEVVATLRSGWLSTGPRVKRFEGEFASYVGAKHGVATNSCTAAMHLCLAAHGIGPGDEVLVPAMTFAATANVVEHVGARPVFVDSLPDGFNLDVDQIATLISPQTRAVMPVHFAGMPVDLAPLRALARQHGLTVIEDAAHAAGAEYRGVRIGARDSLACFSFYVTKNVCTAEGGMITTDDEALADRLRVLALHGMDQGAWQRYSKNGNRNYEVVVPGYKYNLTDMAAALGLSQLRRLERFVEVRTRYAQRYSEAFKDLDELELPSHVADGRHAWHLYPILVVPERLGMTRDELQAALVAENIGTGVHFRAVPVQKFYREKYGFRPGQFPRAEYISNRVLSLPLSPAMSEDDVTDVIRAVRRLVLFYRQARTSRAT